MQRAYAARQEGKIYYKAIVVIEISERGKIMVLDQEPFTRYHEEKKEDTFTVKMNEEERKVLDTCKKVLEQDKDSTALKQLAWIGAKVLHEEKISYILGVVFDNKRKNKRLGIIEFEV